MREEKYGKCAKCGSSPVDDPTVLLHRFPQPNKANKSRCELWAKFCFPDEDWQSPQFQNRLFTEHRMLCDKHFKSTSFEKTNRLSKLSMSEKDCNKDSLEQESLAEPEVVIIKTEPDEEFIEHSVETRSQQVQRIAQQLVKIKHSPKKSKGSQLKKPGATKCTVIDDSTKQRPQKRKAEEQDEIKDSSKKKEIAWENETQDMSQDEFDDTCNEWFGKTLNYEQNDDCELYGKLLTKKLRTYAVYERNLLMFKIDGLLIEHPPGFDTSMHSYSIATPDKTTKKTDTNASSKTTRKSSPRKKSNKASLTYEITPKLDSNCNSDKGLSSSSQLKKKKVKIPTPLSQALQISTAVKESSSVTSTSMPLLSPIKMTTDIPKQQVKVTNSILKKPIKGTSNLPKQGQPVKVASTIQYQPIKVTSSIPNKAVKVTSISNQSFAPEATPVPLPSHLPLQITIPQSKVVPYTQSKFVASSSHQKGKIVIMSKSAKFVPSSQPPILITVPSIPSHSPVSTQCDMNSLEQLSSIAVSHASQSQYKMSYDIEGNEMVDDINVVSNEVILTASEDSPSRNIVEIALKNAYLDEE